METKMEPEQSLESIVDPNLPYRRSREIRAELMDDNLFLIDQTELTIDMLDPMGALIWELLADPISVFEVTDLIGDVFPDIDRNQIKDDVYSLFQTFDYKKLIMVNSGIK